MVKRRIEKLREAMKRKGIHAWMVPSGDAHGSEMPADCDRILFFLTGFGGTAGTFVVTEDKAVLWTDSRYELSAKKELEGSSITIINMQTPGNPSIPEFLINELKEGAVFGFDGRIVTEKTFVRYKTILRKKGIRFVIHENLIAEVFKEELPQPTFGKAFLFDETSCSGKSSREKLMMIRRNMKRLQAQSHVVTGLDEIAWITNLRGFDLPFMPVIYAYMILTETNAFLYAHEEAFDEELALRLKEEGIDIKPYASFMTELSALTGTVLLDTDHTGCAYVHSLSEKARILDRMNPSMLMKSVKNETERANMRKAHRKDGAVMVRFIYWLKHAVGTESVTEESAAAYLEELRKNAEGYLMRSFETISAYGQNASMPHYHADPDLPVVLSKKGFYLTDSGAHYMDGTTDVTRTIMLGPITEEERFHYTIALKSLINLAAAVFPYKTSCSQIDMLARRPLWNMGLDCPHTTGHGVGYVLNVHEGPNIFWWQLKNPDPVISEGMITSDEPGIYIEGSHGIRHENLLLCRKASPVSGMQMMCFESLTLVPFEREAIDPSLLEKWERKWLDDYHRQVYEELKPKLSEEEQKWLSKQCKPLGEVRGEEN